MLILTRKVGESIVLDGGIRITVVQSDAGGVRLGIDAPAEVGIFREEVLERMATENRRASADPATLLEFVKRMGPPSEPDAPPDSAPDAPTDPPPTSTPE